MKFFAVLVLLASTSHAAPSPGAATSTITSPAAGLFLSPHGFRIAAGESNWHLTQPPADTRYIVTMFQSPQRPGETQGSLTVRVDNLKRPLALKEYVNQWMKDYPRFGFEVLGSKPFQMGTAEGYVVDLRTRNSNKQLRQVVFVRNKKAVILTCRDELTQFTETLKACNSIIKTFAWNKLSEAEQVIADQTPIGRPDPAPAHAKGPKESSELVESAEQ